MSQTDHYQSPQEEMVEGIIAGLKNGTSPLTTPYEPDALAVPINYGSGKPYSSINRLALTSPEHDDPRWLTNRQITDNDFQIKDGEKPHTLVFWTYTKQVYERDANHQPIVEPDGKKRLMTVKLATPEARFYHVYNAKQLHTFDGQDLPPYEPKARESDPLERAEALVAKSGAKLATNSRLKKVRYNPTKDVIETPKRETFASDQEYYAQILTGLATRSEPLVSLDVTPPREMAEFSNIQSSVASFYISQELGTKSQPPFADSAQEASQKWISALEADPWTLFKACTQAEKVKEFVMSVETEQAQVQGTGDGYQVVGLKLPVRDNDDQQLKWVPAQSDEEALFFGVLTRSDDIYSVAATYSTRSEAEEALPAIQAGGPPKEYSDTRTILDVPYAEKDAANLLGASWDRTERTWFARPGQNLAPLGFWRMAKEQTVTDTLSPEDEFAKALKDSGFILDGPPKMDGKVYYVPVEGDREGARQGVYQARQNDKRPNGWFKNHLTNHYQSWQATGHTLKDEVIAEKKVEAKEQAADRAKDDLKPFKRLSPPKKAKLDFILSTASERDSPFFVAADTETAKAVNAMTGCDVVIVSAVVEMSQAAEWVKKNHAEKPIVICAVDDHGYKKDSRGETIRNQSDENIGLIVAHKVAHEIGGTVVEPPLTTDEKFQGLKTIGDVFKSRGESALAEVLAPFKAKEQKQGNSQNSGMSR